MIIFKAFMTGVLSAFSMPLGSITALFWSPHNKILAFLIAFGAGSLLAALVIDLVGSTQEKGHLLELIIGSISGSLLFTIVNEVVNNSGGFLRKPSTTLVHLNQRQMSRVKKSFSHLRRVDIFKRLSPQDYHYLACHLLVAQYPPNTIIYEPEDPSESLYIIEEGEVQLLDPWKKEYIERTLTSNDIFGWMSFFTGSPHQMMAETTQTTTLGILPKPDFEKLLQTSPQLLEATEILLHREEITIYLQHRQGLNLTQINQWLQKAIARIKQERLLLDAVPIEHHIPEFLKIARNIGRFPLFAHLPLSELKEIGDRLVYQHFNAGHVFFQTQEKANRFYIVHQGEIELVDATIGHHQPIIVYPHEAFGGLAFVTGALHSVTAIAKTEGAAWVLRKQDFEEMLQQSKSLEYSLGTFLKQKRVSTYLEKKQHFDAKKISYWVQEALQSMNSGQLIPSVSSSLKQHKSAPIAIWLGLLMDGIPEALTIGAHMVSSPISPSLLAGLFISNYPEALSSSEGMKHQGFSVIKIMIMWTSLMLITGILSAIGSVLFADVPESVISLLKSMAAGAMLTVIAETMLPEAYAKGGSVVGISTLGGFLIIIIIKSINFYG